MLLLCLICVFSVTLLSVRVTDVFRLLDLFVYGHISHIRVTDVITLYVYLIILILVKVYCIIDIIEGIFYDNDVIQSLFYYVECYSMFIPFCGCY